MQALGALRSTATIITLRALSSSGLADNALIYVGGVQDVFVWDSSSTATDDGFTVIKPDDVTGTGRWLVQAALTQNPGGIATLDTSTSPALVAPAAGLKESGGAVLTIGSVANGEFLTRDGTTVKGGTPGGGPPSGGAGGDLSGTYPNPAVDKVAGTTPGAFGLTQLDDATQSAGQSTLGLGSAALIDVGTSASKVVQLDGSAKLPAVDGSQLTNLPSGGGVDGPAFAAHLTSDTAINQDVTITNWTEEYDSDNAFSSGVFTVPAGKAGKYLVTACLAFTSNSAVRTQVVAGGNTYNGGSASGNTRASTFSHIFDLAVSDKIEFQVGLNNTTLDAVVGSDRLTFCAIQRIGT